MKSFLRLSYQKPERIYTYLTFNSVTPTHEHSIIEIFPSNKMLTLERTFLSFLGKVFSK